MNWQYFTDGRYEDTPFHLVHYWLAKELIEAEPVDVGEWHAMDVKGNPALVSREIRSVTFYTLMADTVDQAQAIYEPNLPWAEDQFQERVSGEPLNPGETYKKWPWQSAMTGHTAQEAGKFSHTYMERYWPRHVNDRCPPNISYSPPIENYGIRYRYGDLSDLVALLARSPYTRQAVLPVWFPEDTGGVHGGRLPCSLTYHFLLRDGKLHCDYSIRSCDFVRHFRDDVYMTVRLVQWVLMQLRNKTSVEDVGPWEKVKPGTLTMHIGSLHIFEGDIAKLKRELDDDEA